MTTIIISLLLLVSLLPNLTFTAHDGIVNGKEAKPHSRPYMVSLQENEKHVCGGALISDQFVLTAANCWKLGRFLTVVVGSHDLRKSKTSKRFEVKSYILHPKYNHHPNQNDIMLLKLETKVKLSHDVGLISLPKEGKFIEAGTRCRVAGWGRLKINGTGSNRLMEANTKILTDAVCESKWGSTYKSSLMICVHGSGGSCKGDSGGPLVCGNKPAAVGVTSFGDPKVCNSPDRPEVYTKISAYLPWIHSIIAKVE